MIRSPLMPHQKLICDFAYKRNAAAIFSDYGTGKTLCALAIADVAKMRRVLVISTKTSVKATWPDEIRIHTNFQYVILAGTKPHKRQQLAYGLELAQRNNGPYWEDAGRTVIFLVNYEGIPNIYEGLTSVNWDMIVCDESTKIKSVSARRTKIAWALAKRTKRRYIMTGFPVTENLSEIYAQIKFLGLSDGLGSSYYAFLNRFFVRVGNNNIPTKKAIQEIVKYIKDFTIRVTNETLKLPPKVYKEVRIDLTKKQTEASDSLNRTFKLELDKVQIDTQHIFTLITKSLQICDGFVQDSEGNLAMIDTNKDEAVLDVLDEIDIRKHKVVIWCAFLFSIKKLERILKRFRIPTLTLTGATKNENYVLSKFQTSREYNVLLATQKKAAESITLTSARYAIYYSNIWSYDSRGNSEARIRRKGSEKHESIIYVDILTKSEVEKKVYDCLRKKKNLIEELKKSFIEMGGKDVKT